MDATPGAALAPNTEVRSWMAAVEAAPGVLSDASECADVVAWIRRMHSALAEHAHAKRRPRTGGNSRIPMPARARAAAAPHEQAGSTPPPAAVPATPLNEPEGAATPACGAAVECTPMPDGRCATAHAAPGSAMRSALDLHTSRVPLGTSPILNACSTPCGATPVAKADPDVPKSDDKVGARVEGTPAGANDAPAADAVAGATDMPAEECKAAAPAADGSPTASALAPTPSMGSPPKSTRRLRTKGAARGGGGGGGEDGASPSLSTPSFTASPPKSTRRLQPSRSRSAHAGPRGAGMPTIVPHHAPVERAGRHRGGRAADEGGSDGSPLPATPRLSCSPKSARLQKSSRRAATGWSDDASPPLPPAFDASPPRTVQPAGRASTAVPAGAGAECAVEDLLLRFDTDGVEDGEAHAHEEPRAEAARGADDAEPIRSPPAPAAAHPPALDLALFPPSFRAPLSDGAQRLAEVYTVLAEFRAPLSTSDIVESLPEGKQYDSKLVDFLLELLKSRAYLHDQMEGDTRCWRAV